MKNSLNSPGIEVKDAVMSFSWLYSGVSARSLYLGEVGNGDDTSLLPFVVVIRPIFAKERMAMFTSCLPLSDIAILHGGTAVEKVLVRLIPTFLVLREPADSLITAIITYR